MRRVGASSIFEQSKVYCRPWSQHLHIYLTQLFQGSWSAMKDPPHYTDDYPSTLEAAKPVECCMFIYKINGHSGVSVCKLFFWRLIHSEIHFIFQICMYISYVSLVCNLTFHCMFQTNE